MEIYIDEIPENVKISDYPEDTIFVHREYPAKYLLNPFEVIGHTDPRYKDALTREECARELERQDRLLIKR